MGSGPARPPSSLCPRNTVSLDGELFPPTSPSVTMALLEVMAARRVFCSTPQSIRLPFQGLRISNLSGGVWSQVSSAFALLRATCWHLCRCPCGVLTHIGRFFSHTHPGLPMLLGGDSNVWLPPFQLGRSRQADSSLVPIIQERMQSHSSTFQLIVVVRRWDIILATRSLSCHVAVHCGSTCCSVAPLCVPCSCLIISSVLAESTFPSLCLLAQATPPPPCLAFATGHRWLLRAMPVSLSGISVS